MKRLALFLLLAGGCLSSASTPLARRAATVTAYCHCARCNGVAGQPTASGKMPRVGITVAGPRHVRIGTRVHIAGVGVRIVQDRTHRKYDGRWDVFMASHQAAKQFGNRTLKVTILK